MVYVRLARGWTDDEGAAYAAGDMVDIDAVTLAELEAEGVVATQDAATRDGATQDGATQDGATQDKADGHDDGYDGKVTWPGLTTSRPDVKGRTMKWAGLTTPRPDGHGGNGANAPLRGGAGLSEGSRLSGGSGRSDGSEGGGGDDPV